MWLSRDMTKPIKWARLDPYGQVAGTPYTGDVEGLHEFARKDVADIAEFSRDDWYGYYHHPTGRVIRCTLVTMTLPWGTYRFIPEEATKFGPKKHRWGKRQPWPR